MRTTVTLDDDTELVIRQRMEQRRISFKQALNDLVREGNSDRRRPHEFRTRTKSMGVPAVDLDKALAIAGELENEELIRRMETRS